MKVEYRFNKRYINKLRQVSLPVFNKHFEVKKL